MIINPQIGKKFRDEFWEPEFVANDNLPIFLLFGMTQTKNKHRLHKLETTDYHSIVLSQFYFESEKTRKMSCFA